MLLQVALLEVKLAFEMRSRGVQRSHVEQVDVRGSTNIHVSSKQFLSLLRRGFPYLSNGRIL